MRHRRGEQVDLEALEWQRAMVWAIGERLGSFV